MRLSLWLVLDRGGIVVRMLCCVVSGDVQACTWECLGVRSMLLPSHSTDEGCAGHSYSYLGTHGGVLPFEK